MNKLLKGILWGLGIEAAAIGILWSASRVEGTSWAALFGLAAIPLLLVRFPEKPKRRGYRA